MACLFEVGRRSKAINKQSSSRAARRLTPLQSTTATDHQGWAVMCVATDPVQYDISIRPGRVKYLYIAMRVELPS